VISSRLSEEPNLEPRLESTSAWHQPRNHDVSTLNFKFQLLILNQNFAKFCTTSRDAIFGCCQNAERKVTAAK
jgi:hypothetical protein